MENGGGGAGERAREEGGENLLSRATVTTVARAATSPGGQAEGHRCRFRGGRDRICPRDRWKCCFAESANESFEFVESSNDSIWLGMDNQFSVLSFCMECSVASCDSSVQIPGMHSIVWLRVSRPLTVDFS